MKLLILLSMVLTIGVQAQDSGTEAMKILEGNYQFKVTKMKVKTEIGGGANQYLGSRIQDMCSSFNIETSDDSFEICSSSDTNNCYKLSSKKSSEDSVSFNEGQIVFKSASKRKGHCNGPCGKYVGRFVFKYDDMGLKKVSIYSKSSEETSSMIVNILSPEFIRNEVDFSCERQ